MYERHGSRVFSPRDTRPRNLPRALKGKSRFIVAATGPSAKGFKCPDGVSVLAVNNAVSWLPRFDYWFTLDPSPENQKIMQNPVSGVHYFAGVTKRKEHEIPDHVYKMMRISLPRTRSAKRERPTTPEHWFIRWGCIAQMTDDARQVYTGNSAWGGLQVARLLGAKKVLLVGVDGTNERKIDGSKPNNLTHLPLLFAGAVGRLEVANTGKMQCEGIPNYSHEEGVEWLMR